jgi:photosystem II stability/assembly factor-like uncharacterized protein
VSVTLLFRRAVVALAIATSSGFAAQFVPRMLLLDGVVVNEAIVAVGERGAIVRSLDDARTWQPITSGATATLTGVSFASDGRQGWAVGHDALILATTDGGLTWTKQYQGENLQDSFLDVLALDPDRVIAIGAYGLYLVTADGGRSWEKREIIPDDCHLNRISRGPAGTLYVAGERGTLLRSTDQGATWQPIPAPYEGSFYGIVPIDGSTLVAHGLRGRIFRSTDDGARWTAVTTPQPTLLATAVRRMSGFVVFGGQARSVLVSSDGGKTVRPSSVARTTAIAELIELKNGSLLALGEEGASLLEQARPAR